MRSSKIKGINLNINARSTSRSNIRTLFLSALVLTLFVGSAAEAKVKTGSTGFMIETPKNEIEFQYKVLGRDIQRRGHILGHAEQTFDKQSLILESDRDPVDVVLRRTKALVADLKRTFRVNFRESPSKRPKPVMSCSSRLISCGER